MSSNNNLIASWIEEGACVLDLGCGDGKLLKLLRDERKVNGIGVEIDENYVAQCIENSLQVIQADIENGLDILRSNSYDCVILSQTLQELRDPTKTLREMLRVGKQAIVAISNAGHLSTRVSFLFGKLPDAEGIGAKGLQRLITCGDFEALCAQNQLHIKRRCYLKKSGTTNKRWLAQTAVYQLQSNGAG